MLSQLINTAERSTIPLERIKTDGGTQMRATLDADTVQEYLDAMQPVGWGDFPAVVVYYDGTHYWLADGFHRVEAYRLAAANLDQPANVPADVRSGTRRDAILHAAGANASHGLRRTNADKRRAVETLLRDDDWRHWSDREIARRCLVSNRFVTNVRSELSVNGSQIETERTVIRNGTTYTQNTANIGATRTLASETPAAQLPPRPSAISNQQSPISNPAHATVDQLPPADAPLPEWAEEPAPRVVGYSVLDDIALREQADADEPAAELDPPVKPSYDVRRLTADEACTALLGQAIVDAYTVAGAIRLTLDNNQLVTISSPSGGLMYAIEEA